MASILRSSRGSSSAGVARSARSASLRFTSSEPTPTSSSSSDPSSSTASLSPESSLPPPSPSSKPISVQHLLHRRPYLTPPTPPVLTAIRAYNHRISLALSSPLPTHMYFKPGTLPARRFTYETALLENTVFGTPLPEEIEVIERDQAVLEMRERDALELDDYKEGGGLEGVPREERKSCNREGDKSLYLMMRNEKMGGWRFPGGDGRQEVEGREEGRPGYLHETTAHITHSLLGPHISLWPVTRMPIAHVAGGKEGPSTFIFKSHALAGRPVITEAAKAAGVEDFAWLTKQEIRALVENGSKEDQKWWRVVKDILNDN